MSRSLAVIGSEIAADYRAKGKPVYFAAAPYVDAMRSLDSLSDRFYNDSAEEVVVRGLYNLSTWRGETATRVKRELRVMLAEHAPKRYKMPK